MKNDQSKNSEKLSTLQVDEDYIQDDFNLSGLGAQVPYYDYALDLILDADAPGADRLTEEQHELVESAAEVLYGLIHARFVLTGEFIPDVFFCLPAESSEGERREGRRAKKKKKGGKRDAFSKKKKKTQNSGRGLAAVLEKWRSGDYGACPRSACAGQPVLPLGPSDVPRAATVRVW